MKKGYIHQHIVNTDKKSTLISDTLVSCKEPPPFGWTDIILEQTYKYRNRCHGTRFTLLIMQGKYEYKLIMKYMSDTTEYKSCEYKYLKDRSITDIQELQRKGTTKPIPKLLSILRDPKMSYFSQNSTSLWTTQERNKRMNNLMCVFIWVGIKIWQFYLRVRVQNFTRGYNTGKNSYPQVPNGIRNTINNLVNSYYSQILCLIFLWFYELCRLIMRLCELVDVKMTLTFCLFFVVKCMHHCCIF